VLIIGSEGPRSLRPFPPSLVSHCIFEHVYFSRPDSLVFGESVNKVRTNLGRILAREAAVRPTCVVPFRTRASAPQWGTPSGPASRLQFASSATITSGARSSSPQAVDPPLRREGQAEPGAKHPRGAARVLIDDSLVRGTTSRKLVR